jgi:hypothetical protein
VSGQLFLDYTPEHKDKTLGDVYPQGYPCHKELLGEIAVPKKTF